MDADATISGLKAQLEARDERITVLEADKLDLERQLGLQNIIIKPENHLQNKSMQTSELKEALVVTASIAT